MVVALRALDATVETVRPDGSREHIPIADFYRLPGDTPHIETVLEQGELVTAVILPKPVAARTFTERCATAPPMPSRSSRSGAIVQRDGTGRVALGGVAHKPWRIEAAESEMPRGAKAVSERMLAGAKPTRENGFKLQAGRTHAWRRACGSKGLSNEIRHPRND